MVAIIAAQTLRATLPSAYLLVIELTKVVEVPRPVVCHQCV
jgi:hypothetical protein